MEALAFLDTHVVVWLYVGEFALFTPKARQAIETLRLGVSPIVLLEIEYLRETRQLAATSEDIAETLSETIGLTIMDDPFPRIVQHALPLAWTRDPFDRLLVAHATLRKAPLITKDRVLRRHYHCIW